jgi:transposase
MTEELSVEARWHIVHLREVDKLSIRAISKQTHHSTKTVSRWINRFKETGDIADRARPGAPRKTTQQDDQWLVRACHGNRELTANDLNVRLTAARAVAVSDRTVSSRLVAAGLRSLRPRAVPSLTASQKKQRLSWAKKNKKRAWSRVLMADEKTFQLGTYARRVRRRLGEDVQVPAKAHPPKLHVWGCVAESGLGDLHIFQQNLDADKLCSIYDESLLPSAARLFTGRWVLLEDNDPKHKSGKANQWREANNVKKLRIPGYSPDLDTMENVWGVLQGKVAKRQPTTLAGLGRVILEEWAKLPVELPRHLMESMPRRCRAIIDAAGGPTKY